MSVFNSTPPKINKYKFIIWLKENYSFFNKKKLSLIKLNSERDINYLVLINKNTLFVVKISNTFESKKLLEMQDYVLFSLNKKKELKNFIPKKIHSSINTYFDELGRPSYVRILTYIKGNLFAKIKQTNELEISLGTLLGHLSKNLQTLFHEAAYRKFEWDPSTIDWITNHINLFKSNQKKIITSSIEDYNKFVKKNKKNLRFSLTHGDANNYNLVVNKNKIVGLLDYGDMIFSRTINDLAVTLAYALMKNDNLYLTLKNIVLSYHKIFPITFDECYSLMTLVKCRLTITVVMAAIQRKKFPKNKYLSISENDAWKLLDKLNQINPYIFIFFLRDLCGYNIIKNYSKIIDYLKNNKFNDILEVNINHLNKTVVNLNEDSIFSKKNVKSPKQLSKIINSYIKNNNSKIGIGLYGEKRKVYIGKNYLSLLNPQKRRDIHLGIDLFLKVGTNIRAPLRGKVVILNNNSNEFDYGPTVVLEHLINKEIKFYTLYGHLSKSSLRKLKIGQHLKKGEVFAEIGSYHINGNWPTHLHFQIIVDTMEEKNNFFGVCEDFLLSLWKKISPDPNLILDIPSSFFEKNDKTINILRKRNALISKNLSISYKEPVQLLEGKGQYLYDEKGRRYLDCVNNISHVGHCHPEVHKALINQNIKLNTNTRYLYKLMNDYSEKLLNKFPKKLDTIFFVCTGSEANDLAYRIAQTYTQARDVLVMDNAYHGHTNSLIDLSPYKFNGKGGSGKKDYVHIAKMPDGIRGEWKYTNKYWVKKYIQQVKNLIDKIYANNKNLSCFFVESILGCGGQIILPPSYLKEVFKFVHKKNALCIVDEVQTGFGRVGNNFWAFEEHNIIPDIVTLGKPMGNGHPIAAVVTTREIANSFNKGMEYFNSFGGNPVSCAVGNAVLEIIAKEQLQSHAKIVGDYFLNSLKKIQKKYSQRISEVRGRGLFLGIDIINNKNNSPDEYLATKIINNMRDNGILVSADGPFNNVIKIKPPMPFNKNDVDFFLDVFKQNITKI